MQLGKSELVDRSHSQPYNASVMSALESPRPLDNHLEWKEANQSTCYFQNHRFGL